MRFKRIDRSPYLERDISEIDPSKDREKISYIKGNRLLNTLLLKFAVWSFFQLFNKALQGYKKF
jgi:hypothetical protein